MNNIPVFMSQGGTATLILREIPHRGEAYIILRTIAPGCLLPMVAECAAFCRECGAGRCLVSHQDPAVTLPLSQAYEIVCMAMEKGLLPPWTPYFSLVPLAPSNERVYQEIYNACFGSVSHAMTYDRGQLNRVYQCRGQGQQAFLVCAPTGTPCGMGELHGNELAAVGLLPEYRGRGRNLTLQLLDRCPGPDLTLTVVSDNLHALHLYERIGFAPTAVESVWYETP